MAASTPPPPPPKTLLETLDGVQDNWREVESTITQTLQALAKKGMRLSSDISGKLRVISRGLDQSVEQARLTNSQLLQLQALINESALITSTLELDQVLEHVVDTVIHLSGAQRAYLMLHTSDGAELAIRVARNWEGDQLQREGMRYSRSVIDLAISSASPVITTNAQLDARFRNAQSVAGMNLLLVLCIPLLLHGQVIGVLYADSDIERGVFREDMVPLLAAFATQAAIAIRNASVFGQVKHDLAQAIAEVQELRIQIDHERMAQKLSEITESEYFQSLANRVDTIRAEFEASR